MGEGEPEDLIINPEQALENIVHQVDSAIETAEEDTTLEAAVPGIQTEIFPGFPERIEGEIVFCNADVSLLCCSKQGLLKTLSNTEYQYERNMEVFRASVPNLQHSS